ncbi:kinase-like domain-containing protein [Trametes meyenii]|nr:kinase-like domain-containing protein [Trametes meyenii]
MGVAIGDLEGKGDSPVFPDAPWNFNEVPVAKTPAPIKAVDAFWTAYRPWLSTQGLILYELYYASLEHNYRTWCPPATSAEGRFPFARRIKVTPLIPYKAISDLWFAYAQDPQGRDLVIKLAAKDSAEHRINKYLMDRPECHSEEAFPYVLPSITIVDSPYNFVFLAMPTWCGCNTLDPEKYFVRVGQVLRFIRCLLIGLDYLHKHRIAHRDIKEDNILVNICFLELNHLQFREALDEHLGSIMDAAYCLSDFDLSLQLPPCTSLRDCRRPSQESMRGTDIYHPHDTHQGEPYYNPFAFDVACLGKLFIFHLAYTIPTIPALAPLFAKMTTHVLSERFTAAESLEFFDSMIWRGRSETEMSRPLGSKFTLTSLSHPDAYWSKLSISDRTRWKDYKIPPKSLGRLVLEWLTYPDLGFAIISAIRRSISM